MNEPKNCPLRMVKGYDDYFRPCLQAECEWWVEEHEESWVSHHGEMRTGLIAGHCAVHDIARGK